MVCDRANGPARGPRARAERQLVQLFAGRVGPGHTFCGPGRARAT